MTHEQHVESLARELHQAGRAAVEAGLVINKVPGQPFFTWDEITEGAKEGRRVQARYLLERGFINLVVLERTALTSTGTKQRCPTHPDSKPVLARVAGTTRGAWVCPRCAGVLERVENMEEPAWLKDTIG